MMGAKPYKSIKNLKGLIDTSKMTFFNGYSGFNGTDIVNSAKDYFKYNGYFLKINQLNQDHILNMGVSFLNGVMQDRKIETGIIVKSSRFDIANKYWKSGKCPRHYNKKTLKSKDSEVYFLSSLTNDMPFNEQESNFNITSSTKLSAYSPIPPFPNNEETTYALTPDNHILTHSLNTTDAALLDLLSLTNNNHLNTSKSFGMTRSWQQSCSSFGFLSFILLIVLIVVTVVSAGAGAGLWSAGGIFTSATATASSVVVGTGFLAGTAASTIAVVAALGAYTAYQSLWSGKNTSAGAINQLSYKEKANLFENIDGVLSGSSYYLDFLNLKKTLNKIDNKFYFISPKEYKKITSKSLILNTGSTIAGHSFNELLALNTTKEVNFLDSLTYSNAEPATLPPGFRYFGYSKVIYNPLDSSTYNWNISGLTNSTSNIILNVSKLENSLAYTMSGYQLDGTTPNGGYYDLFKTFNIMNTILTTFDKNDFSKYE